MNIHVNSMSYEVYYFTRWLKKMRFCGQFKTLWHANSHVDYLENKLSNGKKIAFMIIGNARSTRAL